MREHRASTSGIEALLGQSLALDERATSMVAGVPAFLARPPQAPVYYGFKVLDEVQIDGFRLGMITDFTCSGDGYEGDAFLVAPDGSRAGLVWLVRPQCYVEQLRRPDADRWGVWAVSFPYRMHCYEDARRNLEATLPELKVKWQEWRTQFAAGTDATEQNQGARIN